MSMCETLMYRGEQTKWNVFACESRTEKQQVSSSLAEQLRNFAIMKLGVKERTEASPMLVKKVRPMKLITAANTLLLAQEK